MIEIWENRDDWESESIEQFLSKCDNNYRVECVIDLLKSLPINGCITGSCWLPDFDPKTWDSDIDIFVYSEKDLIRAIDIMLYNLQMTPGIGTERSRKQEEIKLDMLFKSGVNNKTGITTYKFCFEEFKINISYKKVRIDGHLVPCNNCPAVLMSFDMTIIMQGYDIKTHTFFDMRPKSIPKNVAIPNPLRDHGCSMWSVDKWIRQFDRVVKYYNRGYDTRPMAEFYLEMIDQCINEGYLFDNSTGQEAFAEFSKTFEAKRELIKNWLEEHKED